MTEVSSMPLAYSHKRRPWLFRWETRMSLSHLAKSPMVMISRFFSVSALDLPHIYKEETGIGHIFSSISQEKRVCTLSGFWKSEAIFARIFLSEIPIFTVNPKVSRIWFLMTWAPSKGEEKRFRTGVKSIKHSSTLSCSISGQTSRR